MNIFKISITSAVIISFLVLSGGCSPDSTGDTVSTNNNQAESVQSIQYARKMTKDVSVKLSLRRDGKRIIVSIDLHNPLKKPITSVQNWLAFDPYVLKGQSISYETSDFDFPAPYESLFDEISGIAMLGRSINKPLTKKEIHLADVVFGLIKDDVTMIDVYDYRDDLSGHASVNMIENNIPYNILKKPDTPALIVNN